MKSILKTYENFIFSFITSLVAIPILYTVFDMTNTSHRILFIVVIILFIFSNVGIFVINYLQNKNKKK